MTDFHKGLAAWAAVIAIACAVWFWPKGAPTPSVAVTNVTGAATCIADGKQWKPRPDGMCMMADKP